MKAWRSLTTGTAMAWLADVRQAGLCAMCIEHTKKITVCWLPRAASRTLEIGHAIGQHSSIKMRTNHAL